MVRRHPGGAMTEKPQDPSSDSPSDRPPLADQIRAKVDEYDHEHKGDLERLIDKAAGAVDRSTDGKHAEKIQQVRGSLERGVDRLADQRHDGTPGTTGEPGSDVPPSNG